MGQSQQLERDDGTATSKPTLTPLAPIHTLLSDEHVPDPFLNGMNTQAKQDGKPVAGENNY